MLTYYENAKPPPSEGCAPDLNNDGMPTGEIFCEVASCNVLQLMFLISVDLWLI